MIRWNTNFSIYTIHARTTDILIYQNTHFQNTTPKNLIDQYTLFLDYSFLFWKFLFSTSNTVSISDLHTFRSRLLKVHFSAVDRIAVVAFLSSLGSVIMDWFYLNLWSVCRLTISSCKQLFCVCHAHQPTPDEVILYQFIVNRSVCRSCPSRAEIAHYFSKISYRKSALSDSSKLYYSIYYDFLIVVLGIDCLFWVYNPFSNGKYFGLFRHFLRILYVFDSDLIRLF